MDQELLSMKNFEEYIPVDSEETTIKEKSAFMKNQHMVGIPIILLNIGFLSTKDETHATRLTCEGWKGLILTINFLTNYNKNNFLLVCLCNEVQLLLIKLSNLIKY